MIITEELSVNHFTKSEKADNVWEKLEILKPDHKVKTTAELLPNSDVKLTIDYLDAEDKVKLSKSDTFDEALISRLEVNRGMSNPLGYIISQLNLYGEIGK